MLEVLRQLRKSKGLTMKDVALAIDVSEATVSLYERGLRSPSYEILLKLGEYFGVSVDFLLNGNALGLESEKRSWPPSNIVPLPPMKKIPLVGRIACGSPILAEQNITGYADIPDHIRADFALVCKGDSMINAGIMDGDIVFIHQQEWVENGQIAAVMVGDDEATLKRFYHEGDVVQLTAENSTVPPRVFIGKEIESVRVVGLAVACVRVLA